MAANAPRTYELDPSRFRRVRENRDLSQEAMAKRLNVTTATVSRWERGAQAPKSLTVMAIARRLGVPPSAIAFGDGTVSELRRTAS